MITTTVEQQDKTSEIKYPCIVIDKLGQTIMLYEYRKGFNINGIGWPMGYHSESWAQWEFQPFYGKITLEQKP